MPAGYQAGQAYISIAPSLRGFNTAISREMNKVMPSVGTQAGTTMGTSMGTAAGNAWGKITRGAKFAAGFAAPLAGAVSASIGVSTAASIEQAEIAFETMLGDKGKAQQFIKELSDFAAKTPFEFQGLSESASNLLAVGVEANSVLPIMEGLGNATAGMGTGEEGIARSTRALQQMHTRGKVANEELMQLTEAGIPAYAILADQLGVSTGEVQEMAAAGELGADAIALLEEGISSGTGPMEKFNGLMDKQSTSLGGLWSTFKDTAAVGMADAIKPLLPLMKEGLAGAIEFVSGAAERFSSWLTVTALPALSRFADWFTENRGTILTFAGAFGTIAVAVGTYLTTVKLVNTATRIWTTVTGAANIAMKLLNGTMRLNPVGLIVTAIMLLVGALVLAYNKSETFRNIVDAAFTMIKNVAKTVVDWFVVTAVPFLMGAWDAIASGATWLYDTIIKPVFNGIKTVIEIVWNAIMIIVDVWVWYFKNILAPVFTWLYNTIIKPVFTWIGDAISFVWNNVIKPVFERLGNFISDTVAPAFEKGVSAIKKAWDKIQEIARIPVNFVIDTVYNKGIRVVFNKIAEAVNSKNTLPYATPIGHAAAGRNAKTQGGVYANRAFAKGGYASPGWALVGEEGPELVDFTTPGRVYTARQTQDMLNGPVLGGLSLEGIKGALASAKDWVIGNLKKAAAWVLEPVLDTMSGLAGDSAWGDYLRRAARQAVDSVLGFAGDHDAAAELEGGAFTRYPSGWPRAVRGRVSANTAAAVNFVRSTFGISNIGTLGNRANKSDHPLGKALDVMIPGWNTNKGITLGNSIASWFVKNPRAYGTKYVIWRDRINSGSGWRPYVHPSGNTKDPTLRHMDHVHTSLFDQGGWLMPGQAGVNLTKKPEPVLTGAQWKSLRESREQLIGELNITTPVNATPEEYAEQLIFAMRHIRRGGVYAGGVS